MAYWTAAALRLSREKGKSEASRRTDGKELAETLAKKAFAAGHTHGVKGRGERNSTHFQKICDPSQVLRI